MKDLLKDFPPISKSDWLKKIKEDLKDRSTKELMLEIGEEHIDPFLSWDDQKLRFDPVLRDLKSEQWFIGLDFTIGKRGSKERLLELLNLGLNAPVISFNKNYDQKALIEFLDEVHFENLFSTLQFDDIATLRNGLAYFSERYNDPFGKLIFSIPEQVQFQLALAESKFNKHPVRLSPSPEYQQISYPLMQLSDCLLKIHNKQLSDPNIVSNREYLVIELRLHTNCILEIAKLRAMRILWKNFLVSLQNHEAPLLCIMVRPFENIISPDPDQNLIQSSFQAMSASLGGADIIVLSLPDGDFDKKEYYENTLLKIQHIQQMESHIHQIEDPMAGSYLMEALTNSIAKQVWKIFKRKL